MIDKISLTTLITNSVSSAINAVRQAGIPIERETPIGLSEDTFQPSPENSSTDKRS